MFGRGPMNTFSRTHRRVTCSARSSLRCDACPIRGRLSGDRVNTLLKTRIAHNLQSCGCTQAAAKEAAKYSRRSGSHRWKPDRGISLTWDVGDGEGQRSLQQLLQTILTTPCGMGEPKPTIG
jgi:hypothetical protein